MAVSKKGRRKLIYKDTIFYWHVADWDLEENYPLHIMSEDKTIQLRYGSESFGLYQQEKTSKIFVIKSQQDIVGGYSFSLELDHAGVTPSDIRKILDWYFTTIKEV